MKRSILLIFGGIALLFFSSSLELEVSSARLQLAGGGAGQAAAVFPIEFEQSRTTAKVDFAFLAVPAPTAKFRFLVDDCLADLSINGRSYSAAAFPICRYPKWFILDLQSYLRAGENRIEAVVRNDGGPGKLDIQRSPNDGTLFLLRAAAFTLLVLGAWGLFERRLQFSEWRLAAAAAALGAAVRLMYFWSVLYYEKSHDIESHLEYIRHIFDNFSVPHAKAGFEFHQAPLYYFLLAALARLRALFGAAFETAIDSFLAVSLVCSMGVLAVIVLMSRRLFETAEQRAAFVGTAALIPAGVFHSARVSNDVLQLFLLSAAFFALLIWWQKPSRRSWLTFSVLCALSVLVKASGLLLLVLGGILLLFQRGLRLNERFVSLGILVVIFLSGTGWYFYQRIFIEDIEHIVGPVIRLNPVLLLENTPAAFLTFNPAAILQHPYNNPWDDAERRMYFWEFFFRSVYLGEFDWGRQVRPFAVVCHFAGLQILVLFFWGLFGELRSRFREQLPIAGLLGVFLAGLLIFRFSYPYAPCQDFRFVAVLAVSIAYYSVRGGQRADRLSRGAGRLILIQHTLCCLLLFLAIYHYSG